MPLAVPLSMRAQQLVACGYTELQGPVDQAPEKVIEAVLEALERGETHYTDRPGILPLREQVTRLLEAQFAVKLDAKTDTVITCGVTEARFVAIQQLLTPGEALYAAAYPERLEGALLIRGASLTSDLTTAKVLYLTSRVSEEEQRELLRCIDDQETAVILEVEEGPDNFHPGQVKSFADRTVTIGDLGARDGLKSWRVGFLAASTNEAKLLRDFKQALTICTTNLSQWAALALLEAK